MGPDRGGGMSHYRRWGIEGVGACHIPALGQGGAGGASQVTSPTLGSGAVGESHITDTGVERGGGGQGRGVWGEGGGGVWVCTLAPCPPLVGCIKP